MTIFAFILLATCNNSLKTVLNIRPFETNSYSLQFISPSMQSFLLESAIIHERVNILLKTDNKLHYPSEEELLIYDFITGSKNNTWIKRAIKSLPIPKEYVMTLDTLEKYKSFLEEEIYPIIVHTMVDFWSLRKVLLSNMHASFSSHHVRFYMATADNSSWLQDAFNEYLNRYKDSDYVKLYNIMNKIKLNSDIMNYQDYEKQTFGSDQTKWYLERVRSTKIYSLYVFIHENYDRKHNIPELDPY